MPISPPEQDRLAAENLQLLEVAARRFGVLSHDARRSDLLSAGHEALVFASRRFDPAKAAFKTYASKRVFGSMLNALAAHSEYAGFLARRAEAEGTAVHGVLEESEPERKTLISEVLAALDRLPSLSRDLIKAHYFDERTLASVGALHGLSKTRAFVHLSRALGQLRQALDDEYADWPTQTKATKRRVSDREKARVLRRARRSDASLSELARQSGIPRTTIITWMRPSVPKRLAA